jgi:hypothetical protein
MLMRFLRWLGRRLVSYLHSLMQSIVWATILAALVAIGWVAWPVSGWLLGAYVLHWVLSHLANILYRPGRLLAFRRVTAHAARALAQSVGYVGFGILVVAVAQVLLWVGSQAIEPALVRQTEEWLSYAYHQLLGVLSLEVLAVALAVLVAIVLVQPRSRALSRFLRAGGFQSCTGAAVTFFTFFGAHAEPDPEWRATERYRARAALTDIATSTRDGGGGLPRLKYASWTSREEGFRRLFRQGPRHHSLSRSRGRRLRVCRQGAPRLGT